MLTDRQLIVGYNRQLRDIRRAMKEVRNQDTKTEWELRKKMLIWGALEHEEQSLLSRAMFARAALKAEGKK